MVAAGELGDAEIEARCDAFERFGAQALADASWSDRERALLDYAIALTADPGGMRRAHVEALRAAGLDDGEILDANQVTAYFAYANRVVDGLGVQLEHVDASTAGRIPGEDEGE